MGGMGSGRYSNEKRAKINAAIAAQPSLFGDAPVLPYPNVVEQPKTIRYIPGENTAERLKHIREKVYVKEPSCTVEEYCLIIFEYLRLNPEVYTILDFFEDDNNQPFEYHIEEVMKQPAILLLLEQRMVKGGITGKLKGTILSTVLANQYDWCTSKTESKANVQVRTDEPIQFDFGS